MRAGGQAVRRSLRFMRSAAAALLLAVPLAGCVDEEPTDVGDALLSGQDIVTFEVVLPAAEFLVYDSAFSGYITPIESAFDVVAHSFENTLDANTLLRFSLAPPTITVRTTGTTLVTDSHPSFVSGRLVLKLDTLTTTARPIGMSLFQTAEEWDASATWTQRVDTGSVDLFWTTPGGTRGPQVDTATWADTDSLVFDVDSATLAVWNDSTNKARGAILVSQTAGSRARVLSATVQVNAKSTLRPDTTVLVPLVPTIRTFVYNPVLATPHPDIRAGGIASWRSILQLRSDLRLKSFTCPSVPSGCVVFLDSVHVNTAELLLPAAATPLGFLPEDSLLVEVRPLQTSSLVPIERSPLGTFAGNLRSSLLAPGMFRNPAATDMARINITPFLVHLLDESVPVQNRLSRYLALMQLPEGATFGFASFGPPSLRLVLTAPIARNQ